MQGNGNEKMAFWRKTIREYQKSGLSRRAFSAQKQISKPSLDYWFTKIRKLERPSGLVEVKRSVGNLNPPTASLQVVVGTYRIKVCSGFDPETFYEVVRVLEAKQR